MGCYKTMKGKGDSTQADETVVHITKLDQCFLIKALIPTKLIL